MTMTSEASPLLPGRGKGDGGKRKGPPATTKAFSFAESNDITQADEALPPGVFRILVDCIGAQNLNLKGKLEPYVVVQYGTKVVHRCKPFVPPPPPLTRTARVAHLLATNRWIGWSGDSSETSSSSHLPLARALENPIWTLSHDSLLVLEVKPRDIQNNKPLRFTIWGRAQSRGATLKQALKQKSRGEGEEVPQNSEEEKAYSLGTVRLRASELLNIRHESRVECPLTDMLDRPILGNNGQPSLFSFRIRMATPADQAFVRHWRELQTKLSDPRFQQSKGNIRHEWADAKVVPDPLRPRVHLWTERPVTKSQMSGTIDQSSTPPKNLRVVKPYPHPKHCETTRFLPPKAIETQTLFASCNNIHAGTVPDPEGPTSVGKLHVEVLSCHNLPRRRQRLVSRATTSASYSNPNALVCAIYGDAMVQTDVIEQETSPHWLPWTQRSFCWELQHPAQMLFVSVADVQKGTQVLSSGTSISSNTLGIRMTPIGRVEINISNLPKGLKTSSIVTYSLSGGSSADDKGPTIRLRIRLQIDRPRLWLARSLIPHPNKVYLNVSKPQTFALVRYTCFGSTRGDPQEDAFRLSVLQGYVEEILDEHLRNLLYVVSDGATSLVFWKDDQVRLFAGSRHEFGLPLYSFLALCAGFAMVEHPQWIPGGILLSLASIMLVLMQRRLRNPSPWQRCRPSFLQSLGFLFFGSLATKHFDRGQRIPANVGQEELRRQQEDYSRRVSDDQRGMKRKEAWERELEWLENEATVETKTKQEEVPLELLVILGRVQGILGDVCRLCRSAEAVFTWEYVNLSFCITFLCLFTGIVFLFLPWPLLLRWAGRASMLVVLGPQNMLLGWWLVANEVEKSSSSTVPRRQSILESSPRLSVPQYIAERMKEARINHEEAAKLRAFRQFVFGKYSTLVPTIAYNSRPDLPLPSSHTTITRNARSSPSKRSTEDLNASFIPGQALAGRMIPRPPSDYKVNVAMAQQAAEQVKEAYKSGSATLPTGTIAQSPSDIESVLAQPDSPSVYSRARSPPSTPLSIPYAGEKEEKAEEGFEITDLYSEEADYAERKFLRIPSLRGHQLRRISGSNGDSLLDNVGIEVDGRGVPLSYSALQASIADGLNFMADQESYSPIASLPREEQSEMFGDLPVSTSNEVDEVPWTRDLALSGSESSLENSMVAGPSKLTVRDTSQGSQAMGFEVVE